MADVTRGHDAAYLAGRLSEVEGVAKCDVNPISGLAHVAYDPSVTSVGTIVREARSVGFDVGLATMEVAVRGMHWATSVSTLESALQ